MIGCYYYYKLTPPKPEQKLAHPQTPKKVFTDFSDSYIERVKPPVVFELDPIKVKSIEAMKTILKLSVKDYDAVILKFTQSADEIVSPKVLYQRLSASSNDANEFAKVITNDPILAAKILRIVNSSAYGLRNPITNIKHAVVYLGVNIVKNLTVMASVNKIKPSDDPMVNESYKKFWVSGFIASMLAQRVGQAMGFEEPPKLATTALLTFIGNIAYLNSFPVLAEKYMNCVTLFDRLKAEVNLNQVHAAAVGGELARHWELPESICQHILKSYDLATTTPGSVDSSHREDVLLYACCRLGELVAFKGLTGFSDATFEDYNELDLYYIHYHLQAAQMDNFYKVISQPSIQKELLSIQNLLG